MRGVGIKGESYDNVARCNQGVYQMKVEHEVHPEVCPRCGTMIPLFVDRTGKYTIRSTICSNPDCHSKIWMDDEEIYSEFRVPFGESEEQPRDE